MRTLILTPIISEFDFDTFKQVAIEGLYEEKPLTDEKTVFAVLLPFGVVNTMPN